MNSATVALIGAAVGAAIAGLAAFLNSWAQSRRERQRHGQDVRRAAYVDFLLHTQHTWNSTRQIAREIEKSRAGNSRGTWPLMTSERATELKLEANRVFNDLGRSLMTVDLIGSPHIRAEAQKAAERVQQFNVAVIEALDEVQIGNTNDDYWDTHSETMMHLNEASRGGSKLTDMMRHDLQ